MSYAERRSGKLTGWWYGEVEVRKGATEMRYRKRFQTKGEAEGYEAYVRATGNEPPGSTEAPTESFAAVAASFRARNSEWGRKDPSAIARLEWIEGQLGVLDINQVTTVELDKLVDKLLRTPGRHGVKLSKRSVNRYLDAAAVVLRFALERRLIPSMPHVPRFNNNEGNDRTQVVSPDLETALYRWLTANRDPRITLCIKTLVETGFRKSELWKLRPEQVGNEVITLEKEQTKTGASRVVPLAPDLATPLRAMIAAGAVPSPYQVYRAFKQAVKACGGHEELTLHSLRHTRGTRLIEAGVDSLIVAQLLGHSDTSTTKRYVHPDTDVLLEAAKKVHQARGELREKGAVIQIPLQKTA